LLVIGDASISQAEWLLKAFKPSGATIFETLNYFKDNAIGIDPSVGML